MEHSTEILYNRTRVYCSAVHRFGSDALLLARFSEPKRAWRAADLCSGCGIVSLEWHDRGHRGPCLGLELQPEASALLAAACTEQGIEHITPVCADLRSFREGAGSYDLCACNPPYFTAGEQAADRARATARHETDCTLDDVCKCAFRLLKDGGRLSLCHRPERLAEVLAVLRANRLEPKRLAFVKNRPDAAPWLFLVEAQKNRKTGLRVEPDVLISAGAAMYGRRTSQALRAKYGLRLLVGEVASRRDDGEVLYKSNGRILWQVLFISLPHPSATWMTCRPVWQPPLTRQISLPQRIPA